KISLTLKLVDHVDQIVDGSFGQTCRRDLAKLLLDLCSRQWILRASAALLDECGEDVAVVALRFNSHRVPFRRPTTIEVRIVDDVDSGQKRKYGRIGEAIRCVLIDESVPVQKGHRGSKETVHLRGEDFARPVRPADIQMTFLAHADGQTLKIGGREASLS